MSGKVGGVEDAVRAIQAGNLVVYPTETVYGLGADALDPSAISRVFEAKQRSFDNPLSVAVPTVTDAREVVEVSSTTEAFMDRFLPGPVTVVCPKKQHVPDVLTSGQSTVGVRVPDHALARQLLSEVFPITATSANISGHGGANRTADVDESILAAVAWIIDGGETNGGVSTVVDPEHGVIYREGLQADVVQDWLKTNRSR